MVVGLRITLTAELLAGLIRSCQNDFPFSICASADLPGALVSLGPVAFGDALALRPHAGKDAGLYFLREIQPL